MAYLRNVKAFEYKWERKLQMLQFLNEDTPRFVWGTPQGVIHLVGTADPSIGTDFAGNGAWLACEIENQGQTQGSASDLILRSKVSRQGPEAATTLKVLKGVPGLSATSDKGLASISGSVTYNVLPSGTDEDWASFGVNTAAATNVDRAVCDGAAVPSFVVSPPDPIPQRVILPASVDYYAAASKLLLVQVLRVLPPGQLPKPPPLSGVRPKAAFELTWRSDGVAGSGTLAPGYLTGVNCKAGVQDGMLQVTETAVWTILLDKLPNNRYM